MEQQTDHFVNATKMATGNLYAIWISSESYKKLLCIQIKPELNIWYKDEKVSHEELIKILNK